MQGSEPVTGKMPVPQVLLLKWKHYIVLFRGLSLWDRDFSPWRTT